MAQAQIATWRQAYRGLVPEQQLDTLDHTCLAMNWPRNWPGKPAWVVCSAGESIGAFARLGDAATPNDTGEGPLGQALELVGGPGALTVPDNPQHWLAGCRLVGLAADRLVQDGHQAMIAWAPSDREHRRFFEGLEAQEVATRSKTTCGQALPQVAYGWRDLERLRHLALKSLS